MKVFNKKLGLCIAILIIMALATTLVLAVPCVEDTDDGDDPYTYGAVLDANDTELCADSCAGTVLTECTCVGGETISAPYDCALSGKVCTDGACVCVFEAGESCDTEAVGECSETEDNWGADCDWNGCVLTFSEREDEDCDDEKDNDCDGKTDCADPSCSEESICADAVITTGNESNESNVTIVTFGAGIERKPEDYDYWRNLAYISQFERPEWGKSWCAPASAGMSFNWFADNSYPKLLDINDTFRGNLSDVVDKLGEDMGTGPGGTNARGFVSGIKKYLKERYPKDFVVKVFNLSDSTEDPSYKVFERELLAGEDVMIGFWYAPGKGHIMAADPNAYLTGQGVKKKANADGTHNVSFADPLVGRSIDTIMYPNSSIIYKGHTTATVLIVSVSPIESTVDKVRDWIVKYLTFGWLSPWW